MFRTVFQGTVIRNEPAYRPRPVTMPGYHRFSNGDYHAFVALSALEAIADKTRESSPNEMIGYLVGRPFRDAKGTYTVVTQALVAKSARCGPVTVETTLDDERWLVDTLQADHPLAERLGWFHSHPFNMSVYSPTDLENQRFWSEPYQLGLLACLDRPESVSIYAFLGPEAQAIHPPYTASCSPPTVAPPFRPMPGLEVRASRPKRVKPTRPKCRRPSLILLTLTVGLVWPLTYLAGAWMIVQVIREGRDSAARTLIVPEYGTGPGGPLDKGAQVEVQNPVIPKTAEPAPSVGQRTPECHRPQIADR